MKVEAFNYLDGKSRITGVYYESAFVPALSPTLILLHGLTGSVKNTDIAYEIQSLGWNSLVLNFRGAFDSPGRFNLLTQFEDVQIAVNYLRERKSALTNFEKIAVLGYSFGSRAAIEFSVAFDVVKLILIAGIAYFRQDEFTEELAASVVPFVSGVKASELQEQWNQLALAKQPIDIIRTIPSEKVTLIYGDADAIVPIEHSILLHKSAIKSKLYRVNRAGHEFVGFRRQLRKLVWTELSDLV